MFPKDILKRAEKREARSLEYEKRYKSGDDTALREFCRVDIFSIKTPWVQKVIEISMMTGNMEPLKNLFPTGKREKNIFRERTQDILIKDAVNRTATETGLPKTKPKPGTNETVYDAVYNDQTLTFGRAQAMSPKTILNHCSMSKNQSADIMIEHTLGGNILRCGPTMVTMEDKPLIGIFEIFFPADGSESYFNANGVFNIPTGKNKHDMLPKSFNPIA